MIVLAEFGRLNLYDMVLLVTVRKLKVSRLFNDVTNYVNITSNDRSVNVKQIEPKLK